MKTLYIKKQTETPAPVQESHKHYYLTRISSEPNLYHPFPDFNVSQDTNTDILKNKHRLQIKSIPQKDGSRFKLIYSEKMQPSGIIESLHRFYGNNIPIFQELNSREFIENHTSCKYFIVHTHTFLDSMRVIPIVANYSNQKFYNASSLFPHLTPEDGLGILIKDPYEINNLIHPRFGPPSQIVEYLADKRVCVGCGRVVDYSVPVPVLNWQSVEYIRSYWVKMRGKIRHNESRKRGRPKKTIY